MNNKVILTDCDGVLCDWVGKYVQWMLRQGYVMKMYPEGTYDMEKVFGIDKDECKKLVRMFNESADIQYMAPLRDAFITQFSSLLANLDILLTVLSGEPLIPAAAASSVLIKSSISNIKSQIPNLTSKSVKTA